MDENMKSALKFVEDFAAVGIELTACNTINRDAGLRTLQESMRTIKREITNKL